MAGRRCWGGHNNTCRRSIPSVRFGSVRGGPFGFPSGERRADRRLAGSTHVLRKRILLATKRSPRIRRFHWTAGSRIEFGQSRRIYRHAGVGHKNTALVPYPTGLIGAGALALISGGRTARLGRSTDKPSEQCRSCAGRAMAAFGVVLVWRGGMVGCSLPLALPGRRSPTLTGKSRAEKLDARCNRPVRHGEDRRSCIELSSLRARGDNATAPFVFGSRRGPCATP